MSATVFLLSPLLAPAEDHTQPLGWDVQRPVQVVGTSRSNGETGVEASNEARQERVAGLDAADPGHAQLLHQPVLPGAVDTFHPAFGLARARAQDLDGELGQGAAELGHALTALGVLPGHAED